MNASRTIFPYLLCSFLVCIQFSCSSAPKAMDNPSVVKEVDVEKAFNVLVFSKTEGFRHKSIPAGIEAITKLGVREGFGVDATEDASRFQLENLVGYDAVIFLNTTLDVLNVDQQAAFQSYIQQGGGFVGIHGAADTEYDWEWYGGLVGAYFKSHPQVQPAEVQLIDRQPAFAEGMPASWIHTDEWYNYNINPRENVHVLAVVKEKSYEGGEMGHDHPIAWAHIYDGGRAFYTGLGHTSQSYSDSLFLQHLVNGINWAAGQSDADVTATMTSHYEKVVLTGEITNPMEIDITNDGRVFVVEWGGAIKIWEPDTEKMRVAGWIPVDKSIEDGLLGMALDPAFDENGWMYIFYSPIQGEQTSNRLSRFTYDGEWVQLDSELIMLEIPNQRLRCCHSAGSVQFDIHGNLFLSTGDNSGGDRDHEDPMYRKFADQGRTAANTNDLRGKILRITPQPDGSYSIPDGNLFVADSLHRGEIYTMGHRNPFRYSIDEKTGWVYWGDVGPGARGGFDEFNQAKQPGFFGWPLFTGYNVPFTGYYFHGAEGMDAFMNPEKPINASPYNSGAHELPPAQPAFIPYLYGMSEEFPELGAGGMNPMAGPVFHYKDEDAHEHAIPSYYNGKLLIYEWMRHWLQIVTLDESGNLLKIDPFLPGIDFVRPMDVEVGPDGRLYVVEWGDEFWGSNENAQLVRVDYYAGQPPPVPEDLPATQPEAPLAVKWPPEGGVFDFDTSIPYEISIYDQALSDEVKLTTYTGFDTSPFPLDELNGLAGNFVIDDRYTHHPDINYFDRFGVLEACLDNQGVDEWCKRIRLNPSLKEAEHITAKNNAQRLTYSTHPASEYWGSTALTVMRGRKGMQLQYSPFNVTNVDSLTLRYRADEEFDLHIQLYGQEVITLADFSVGPEKGIAAVPSQYAEVMHVPEDTPGIPEIIERAYHDWREITVPIAAHAQTGVLTIDVDSYSDEGMFELDWLRFFGDGVSQK